MNPLRMIILLITFIFIIIEHPKFILYFLGCAIPYILITQYLFFNSDSNTPKNKVFLSQWSYPYDPQIYTNVKFHSTKLKKFFDEYYSKEGVKIGLTTIVVRLAALALKKFPQINGNIIFGRFIPKENNDVTCMISSDNYENTDFITIKDADKISINEISRQLKEKKEKLSSNTDSSYNMIKLIAQILPTL